MKNFTLYYETFENHLFTKDVGIIAYIMQKYYGYNSRIRCSQTKGEIVDNKKYVEDIDFKVFESDDEIDEVLRTTDVLMLLGIYNFNMNMILRYRAVNPNGKIYLKLDANPTWMFGVYRGMTQELLNCLAQCNIISTESRRLRRVLSTCFGLDIRFLPNGHYDFTHSPTIDFSEKENTILFAGMIGSEVKCNHILIDAFKNVADQIPDWKVELAGPVEDQFLVYLSQVFKERPDLKSRIKLLGKLDKEDVKEPFKKAKVFCLTSFSEACAHVFSESIYNGCYLISTDVDGAIDIMDYGRYGQLFPVFETKELEKCLLEVCSNQEMLKENCKKSQEYALENLTWVKVCSTLDNWLR